MNYQTSNLNEFTDEEIREQLAYLGFKNVSKEKFNQFKNDLEKLIAQEVSINSNSSYSEYCQIKKENDDSRREYSSSPTRHSHNKKVTFPNDSQLINNDYNEEEDDGADSDQSFVSIVTTSSIVDNKVIKRKIVRKADNHTKEKSSNPQKSKYMNQERQLNNEFSELDVNDTIETELNDISEFEDDQDEQLVKLNDCYPPIQYPMKSFIRSQSSLSTRSDVSLRPNLKSNPVNRFHEYNKLWNKQKVPGEKKHNHLRWSIREQMLVKDVIVKKQPKSYEPNDYTIPTDKKRQQLRWAVRNALANQF